MNQSTITYQEAIERCNKIEATMAEKEKQSTDTLMEIRKIHESIEDQVDELETKRYKLREEISQLRADLSPYGSLRFPCPCCGRKYFTRSLEEHLLKDHQVVLTKV
jgi:DNA repair exonuclease SbcCD ATPase subunit